MRSITSRTERETFTRMLWLVITAVIGLSGIAALVVSFIELGASKTFLCIVVFFLLVFALGGWIAQSGEGEGLVDRGGS